LKHRSKRSNSLALKKCLPSLIIILCILLFAISGCSQFKLLQPSHELPETWANRALYNTPNAFIYASSEKSAVEADSLLSSIRRDFEKETDSKASKGLIIVTDCADEPVINDFREMHRLLSKSHTAKLETNKNRQQNEIRREMKKQRISQESLLRITPVIIEKEYLEKHLGFPGPIPDSARWAAAIPTKATIRHTNDTILENYFRNKGISQLAQIALAPIIFLAKHAMLNMVGKARDMVLFEQLVMHEGKWSAEEKKRRAMTYSKRKLKEAQGIFIWLKANDPVAKKAK